MSELAGKEIVDVSRGVRLGALREADLLIDAGTGRVEALVLPVRRGWFGRGELVIPWRQVLVVGPDVVVVDLQPSTVATPGIPPPPGGRLGSAPESMPPSGKESVIRGNGHWGLRQPRSV